jgi:hypothetical protein
VDDSESLGRSFAVSHVDAFDTTAFDARIVYGLFFVPLVGRTRIPADITSATLHQLLNGVGVQAETDIVK